MKTLTIKYDDTNKYSLQLIESLIGAGIFFRIDKKESELEHFNLALQETEAIIEDISKNGTEGYKTLEDLLNEN